MIKLLIIEDNSDHLDRMIRTFSNEFGDKVEIFPKMIDSYELDYKCNNYLIGRINEGKFGEVLNFYFDVRIFIIDASLLNNGDRNGVLMAKHILQNSHEDYKIFLVSNNTINDPILTNIKVHFISKYDKGIFFPLDLVKVIRHELPELNSTMKSQFKIRELSLRRSLLYNLHLFKDYFLQRSNRLVDFLIQLGFYFLIGFTLFHAIKNIYNSMNHFAFISPTLNNVSSNHDLNTNEAEHPNDINILTISEHIFLYILPVFIVLGFYTYYRNFVRIKFLNGRVEENDIHRSNEIMDNSKTMFLSSLVSYVIIKCIEKIYVSNSSNIIQLIAYGLFLIILLSYYLVIGHKRKNEN